MLVLFCYWCTLLDCMRQVLLHAWMNEWMIDFVLLLVYMVHSASLRSCPLIFVVLSLVHGASLRPFHWFLLYFSIGTWCWLVESIDLVLLHSKACFFYTILYLAYVLGLCENYPMRPSHSVSAQSVVLYPCILSLIYTLYWFGHAIVVSSLSATWSALVYTSN